MSLDWQKLPIAITEGMDTRTNPKLVSENRWRSLINVSFAGDGTPKRRDAWTPLIAGRNGNGLAIRDTELVSIRGPAAASISTSIQPVTGAFGGSPIVGELGHVSVSKQEVQRSTGLLDEIDCASGQNFTLYVWRNINPSGFGTISINYTLRDEVTGTSFVTNGVLDTSASIFFLRCVFATDRFYVFWISDATGTPRLMSSVILLATPAAFSTPVALVTDAHLALNVFDVCSFGGSTPAGCMVSYIWTDGVTSVRSINVGTTAGFPAIIQGGATGTAVIAEATVPRGSISAISCTGITVGGGAVAGTFVTSSSAFNPGANGVWGATIGNAWTVVTAATRVDATADFAGPPTFDGLTSVATAQGVAVFSDRRDGAVGFAHIRRVTVSSTLGVVVAAANLASISNSTSSASPRGPWIYGKAFVADALQAQVYLPTFTFENYSGLPATTVSTNQQNTFFLMDGNSGIVVAKALYGTFGATTGTFVSPCSTPSVGPGVFAIAVPEQGGDPFFAGIPTSLTGVARVTLTPVLGPFAINPTAGPAARAPIKAQLGPILFLAGGSLTTYDGASLVEHGFPLFPEGIKVTATVIGGGTVAAGTYQVVAIYEWVDNQGLRHQSAPSLPVSVTVGGAGTNSITALVPTLLVSQKTGVNIVLFVTPNGGVTFNRATRLLAPVPNVTTAENVTATITADPATFAGNELLYHQPAVPSTLANNAPGPCSFVNVHQNRLWVDVADDPYRFRFSQEFVPGLGLQFNEDLGGVLPQDSGGYVAGVSLDEKQIILASRKLFAVFGAGPNADGSNNGYSEPQAIPSDVGCSDARSVLQMPHGIIFKSAKGWYMLGRDLTVQYIGDGAQAFDSSLVTSAVLLEDRRECRFTLEAAANSVTTLVYDYLKGQWSTYARFFTGYQIQDAVWWPTLGAYVHVSATNGLNQDSAGVVIDTPGGTTGSGIYIQLQTAWLRLSQLEGFQRARWLYVTASGTLPTTNLSIQVDYDDADNQVAPGSYTSVNSLAGLFASGSSIDIRHRLRRQKCKSMCLTFLEINAPTTQVPLVGIQALTLEVGVKRGINKTQATQTFA